MSLEVIPIRGIEEIRDGDDLVQILAKALSESGVELAGGDIVVVTHKVVSKAEGAVVDIAHEAAHQALVEDQAEAILRRREGLVIAVTRHGFVCANAGVDRSNVGDGRAVLLPDDPDASAHRIRRGLEQATGMRLGVVITDTFGRPWRRGLVDVAIGVSGLPAILDLRGTPDMFGRILQATEVALADEIAAAADLVMGKSSGIPAVVVRGLGSLSGDGKARDLIRPPAEDFFR